VGSHILQTLAGIQHQDLQLVAACRDPSKLIPEYNGEVRRGDLRDPDYLDRVLTGIDIICHAAGWSSFERSGKTANHAYLEPTLELINHAIEWRVSRFINLSSIYVAAATKRDQAETKGHPRVYWPMMNCHLAVEDYMRNYQKPRCQFVNLRLGLYSGKRLNTGLLPLLLARNNQMMLPGISGRLGHLPLVDGRDIGQAFVRAALAPLESSFTSLNIAGPQTPTHSDVMQFIAQQLQTSPLTTGLPSSVASFILWLRSRINKFNNQPLITLAMIDMLKAPLIDNTHTRIQIGYDPEISWQASLLDTIESHKNQLLSKELSQYYRTLNL